MKCWIIHIIVKNSFIKEPCLKYIFYGGDFLYWIKNAYIQNFTLKTLENLTKKAGCNLFCADENTNIHSVFKNSLTRTDYNL